MNPYSTPGMYGMDQGMAPNANPSGGNMDAMRQKMLLNYMSGQNNQEAGPGQIGNALITAMLMNPDLMKKAGKGISEAGDSIWSGLGNWFRGDANWNGTPTAPAMGQLEGQAAANAPMLSGGWGGGGVV
tara:strand:- start:278 stop:664 length:387 start_codon:yes stop_codon:yes gene_type:complete